MPRRLPTLDLGDFLADEESRRDRFVSDLEQALRDIGFFALSGHGIAREALDGAYEAAQRFFALPEDSRHLYERPEIHRQRGYTPFAIEHAKDQSAADLKAFWSTGRTVQEPRPGGENFPENIWPTEHCPSFEPAVGRLYREMDELSMTLLRATSLALGEAPEWLPGLAARGNTVLRVLYYPPVAGSAPAGSVRSAEHEDINLMTLLVGATADGLQVKDHDGSWIEVEGRHEHIIVDSGDMLQSLTNGLFRSTTHRVVNPPDSGSDRYSMPLFVHPRDDVDLSPRPQFVARTGGEARYPSITAGKYLHQRLVEIGLVE